jgi:hypothetical protein
MRAWWDRITKRNDHMSIPITSTTAPRISDQAWKAIEGGFDLQVHVAPDVISRRIDDLDLAREFLRYRLGGFVLKSHYIQTAERAKVVSKSVPGVSAFGALTLNHAMGGLNPVAVEIAGRSGAKIVWMPTVDAENETAALSSNKHHKVPFWAEIQRDLASMGIMPPRIKIIDENLQIVPQAVACLELIGRHDMVLATGHLGRDEIYPLVKLAREMKIKRVLVTHAEFPSQNLSAGEQVELADMGAMIEHCFTTMYTGKAPWETVLASIREVGPERCILSTDLGQTANPPVAEGFAMFADKMLENSFSFGDVRRMAALNSADYVQ